VCRPPPPFRATHSLPPVQVFANRALNDAVGYFFGNVMQGFSVAWWKNKHNTHHAVPNLHGSGPAQHNGAWGGNQPAPRTAGALLPCARGGGVGWGRVACVWRVAFGGVACGVWHLAVWRVACGVWHLVVWRVACGVAAPLEIPMDRPPIA
jgi:hypothetical protein